MNTVPVQVGAMVMQAGVSDPPRPHALNNTTEVFCCAVGAERLNRVTVPAPDGKPVVFWLNAEADALTLTHNDLATRLYQRLSPQHPSGVILGDVLITGDNDDVPWSAVRLAQRLYLSYEKNLSSALKAHTERARG